MAKNKSISEQIEDLQRENERLQKLDKLFEKAIKTEFKMDRKSVHKMIEKNADPRSKFEEKLLNYFHLESIADMDDFLSVMCTDRSVQYFNSRRGSNEFRHSQQGSEEYHPQV